MLEEVNHLGFVFSSVNLITKGVKIKLESDLIFEIFNKRSICVYVIKNDANETVDGDQISFRITTEVDPFDLEKIEMLKVWLGQIRNRRIL